MWFKREQNRNRRRRRNRVLDVKLRSDQVRATRVRWGVFLFLAVVGPFFGLYLLWRVGEMALNAFVYNNSDFAIQRIEVQTDGAFSPDQVRRWSGVRPGANLFALDLASVKRNLELVSTIASVSVERELPRTLKIFVTEREPVAQVNVPHASAKGGIVVSVFQLDAGGEVMQPLDPRLCTVPLDRLNSQLPVIDGLNVFQLQPGRRVDLPPVQAALRLILAFGKSPMAGLVHLRHVDVSASGVLVATTGQGSVITFGLDNFDQQLRRWRQIYDLGMSQQETIATVNLAVANNVPVRWMASGTVPEPLAIRTVEPLKPRRKNV